MITTLDLTEEVLARLNEEAALKQKSVDETANELILRGLQQEPFRVKPFNMGLREGFSYDSISTLIALAEGDDHR
jgi:hypothetical protein